MPPTKYKNNIFFHLNRGKLHSNEEKISISQNNLTERHYILVVNHDIKSKEVIFILD